MSLQYATIEGKTTKARRARRATSQCPLCLNKNKQQANATVDGLFFCPLCKKIYGQCSYQDSLTVVKNERATLDEASKFPASDWLEFKIYAYTGDGMYRLRRGYCLPNGLIVSTY